MQIHQCDKYINKLKDKKHTIISTMRESFQHNSTPIYDLKNTPGNGHSRIIKAIYNKPTANIILNGDKLKTLTLRSGKR